MGELVGEPVAGVGFAVGEDDVAGCELFGEVEELFAVGVAAEVVALNVGGTVAGVVELVKEEAFALGGGEEFAARGIRVAVADECKEITGVGKEAGSNGVAWGVFHHHAAAEDVDGGGGPRGAARANLGREGADAELFDDGFAEANGTCFAGDFVEVVHEVEAKA